MKESETSIENTKIGRSHVQGGIYSKSRRQWDIRLADADGIRGKRQLFRYVQLRGREHLHRESFELDRLYFSVAGSLDGAWLNVLKDLTDPLQPGATLFGESLAENEHFARSCHRDIQQSFFFLVLLIVFEPFFLED